jgi:hypothetical protein
MPINGSILLNTTGIFVIKVDCGDAEQIIISNVISVACSADEPFTSGRCGGPSAGPAKNATCGGGEVHIGSVCKQLPLFRVLSDSQAIFDTVPGSMQTLLVRLVLQGGFDIQWDVSVEDEWLQIRPDSGQLRTSNLGYAAAAPDSAAEVILLLNATQQKDFSVTGDLHSTLKIAGSMPSRRDVIFEGQSILVPVRMRVAAMVCVELQDVLVQAGSSGPQIVGGDARVYGIEPKSNVVIYVRAHDCQRSPIQRHLIDQPLHLHMGDGGTQSSEANVFWYAPTEAEKNLFQVTLPQAWVNSTGEVPLIVFTNVSGVVVSAAFTLVIKARSFPVSEVVGGMIAIGMGVLVLFLLRILRNNRVAFKETLTAYLKFELVLGFEISAPDPCIMTLVTGLPTAAFSRHGKGRAGCVTYMLTYACIASNCTSAYESGIFGRLRLTGYHKRHACRRFGPTKWQ